jgi:hypothetical protein
VILNIESETSALYDDDCSREYLMSHLIILHPHLVSIIYEKRRKTTNPSSGRMFVPSFIMMSVFIKNCCEGQALNKLELGMQNN